MSAPQSTTHTGPTGEQYVVVKTHQQVVHSRLTLLAWLGGIVALSSVTTTVTLIVLAVQLGRYL